ncbi:MAG TPA: histidine kinase dimerization/phospho-acceptor domain-containing protein, partial [Vicinamibacterales bacterium]|nr:histidine kinase dimerization/phospho-acceptor domain-containing protein [Vicinamibacterales bacterium]
MTLSLRARLTLWYTVVLVVVLAAFAIGVVWMQGRIGLRNVDEELAEADATAVKIIANELEEQAPPKSAAAEATETLGAPSLGILVFDGSGGVLSASPSAGTAGWRSLTRDHQIGGHAFRVTVSIPLAGVEREQQQVRKAMIVAIPIILLLAGGGGWWLASIGLAPITEMAGRAVRLPLTGTEDLGEPARRDELGQLTRAFNGLVSRLRTALQTQQQFMADASHELRTPVSIIRSAAEVGLSRERRDETEYRETLAIARDQARRLTRLVEDMLVLARADAGGYPVHPVNLDLGEVVDDCRRAVKVIAAERGVQLQSSTEREVPFRGDEDLLRRLVTNLLQNAIQHTRPGGSVAVGLASENG